MIAQGTNPGGPTDRPRSRSLNLDHPARPFHDANPTNASRATFDGFERSINRSTLCPENRARYTTHSSRPACRCAPGRRLSSGVRPRTRHWRKHAGNALSSRG